MKGKAAKMVSFISMLRITVFPLMLCMAAEAALAQSFASGTWSGELTCNKEIVGDTGLRYAVRADIELPGDGSATGTISIYLHGNSGSDPEILALDISGKERGNMLFGKIYEMEPEGLALAAYQVHPAGANGLSVKIASPFNQCNATDLRIGGPDEALFAAISEANTNDTENAAREPADGFAESKTGSPAVDGSKETDKEAEAPSVLPKRSLRDSVYDVTVATIMHNQICPYLRGRLPMLGMPAEVNDNEEGCVLSMQAGIFVPTTTFYISDITMEGCDGTGPCNYSYTVSCYGNSLAGSEGCSEIGSGLVRQGVAEFENGLAVRMFGR